MKKLKIVMLALSWIIYDSFDEIIEIVRALLETQLS